MATEKRFIVILLIVGLLLAGFVIISFTRDIERFHSAGTTGNQPPMQEGGKTFVQPLAGPEGNPVFMVTVIAPQGGNVIAAEFLRNNRKGLDAWKFFQDNNTDIRPGDR